MGKARLKTALIVICSHGHDALAKVKKISKWNCFAFGTFQWIKAFRWRRRLKPVPKLRHFAISLHQASSRKSRIIPALIYFFDNFLATLCMIRKLATARRIEKNMFAKFALRTNFYFRQFTIPLDF